VFRTALAALGSREDAEDAAQEAFVVAWQKLPGFRGDATFRTWLLTIVWRKALDRRRTRRLWWLRTESGGRQSGLDPLEHVAGALPDPEDTAITRDLARRLAGHIAGLSQKLRDTLLLAASGEHSYSEISVMLGIPLGTVKWRVTEARRILTAKVRAGTGTNI
jgi:RNA polymerase sigma-70 factor (ECF subfamily)